MSFILKYFNINPLVIENTTKSWKIIIYKLKERTQ